MRRTIFTPGLNSAYYLDFFSNNPLAQLGHGLLRSFVNYPYDVPPSYLIGRRYFDSDQVSANANIWADVFANFGWVGVVVVTVGLAAIFFVYDSVSKRRDFRIATLMIALPAFSLSDTAFLTTLLTHGLGLSMMLVMLSPRAARPNRDSGGL